MHKYFVIVDEDKTIRFFKDEKCTIFHREDGSLLNLQTETNFIILKENIIEKMVQKQMSF